MVIEKEVNDYADLLNVATSMKLDADYFTNYPVKLLLTPRKGSKVILNFNNKERLKCFLLEWNEFEKISKSKGFAVGNLSVWIN